MVCAALFLLSLLCTAELEAHLEAGYSDAHARFSAQLQHAFASTHEHSPVHTPGMLSPQLSSSSSLASSLSPSPSPSHASSPALLQDAQAKSPVGTNVVARGWVRSVRKLKEATFVDVSDGSSAAHLQVILPSEHESVPYGSSVEVTGVLQASQGKAQGVELRASEVKVLGGNDVQHYPIQQRKRLSLEQLREIAHLRPRTRTFSAVMRVRNTLAQAVHSYMQAQGFLWAHTPLLTSSDCEGGGEVFQVITHPHTRTDPQKQPSPSSSSLSSRSSSTSSSFDPARDFFGAPAYLTVSGQLHAEMLASALGRVYTFGPTFRAERSHTSRHLAEFWMIEPEMAFADLYTVMDLAEEVTKHSLQQALVRNADDIQVLSEQDSQLQELLQRTVSSKFVRITYAEAVSVLQKSAASFQFPLESGCDLQTEHEKYLTETHFRGPVFVTDWPKHIKPFYMRVNDDNTTVSNMDLLLPRVGELAGGSAREERESVLRARMQETAARTPSFHLPDYEWYLQLRRFGSVPHAGFGIGFERLVQYATGMSNIRDVIPVPRHFGNCAF